ncbi:MAG: Flp pilus assembly complex ATPase component TadA [Planctomycetes bacterium]|nr:Flp pilus assembly complex ATPase component TadA [Planctomycetota bacterium]
MSETETILAMQPLLVRLLMERGVLQADDLSKVQDAAAEQNLSLEDALVRAELATEEAIARAYAEHFHLPVVNLDAPLPINKDMAMVIGAKVCRDRMVVPLACEHGTLEVAFANPTDLTAFEEIQLLTEQVIQPVMAPLSMIEDALGEVFGKVDMVKEISKEASQEVPSSPEEDLVEEIVDLNRPVPKGRDSHVIRLVNHILASAVRGGASDIHLEPFENSIKVRFRIDGRLQELSPPPIAMYVPMLSRLKVLSKMDIAERRVPQDGAIGLTVDEGRVDLRVSTVPTVYGEKMVLRILTKGAIPLDLTKLGFSRKQADDFEVAASCPHGLLLVTGPTGSGKSTTLYATLNLLNKPDVNVMTVEDPVEYKFEGLNQVHVRGQVGLTFASALRAFLRQDPDVIMVGEVRDQETAQICLRAALTGHLVLSTLHTNDALAAVNRLVDMGVERFLLASALRLVEAQRLVRRLCEKCKEAYRLDAETAAKWNLDPKQDYFRPRGCEICRSFGYKGRVGLFEVIRVTPKLRDLIGIGAPLPEIHAEARRQQIMLLSDAGLEKVREGVTSLEEVLSVCMTEADE